MSHPLDLSPEEIREHYTLSSILTLVPNLSFASGRVGDPFPLVVEGKRYMRQSWLLTFMTPLGSCTFHSDQSADYTEYTALEALSSLRGVLDALYGFTAQRDYTAYRYAEEDI